MVNYSVESIREAKFQRHGDVKLKVIDNSLFWFECAGPFNEEIMAGLGKLLAPIVSERQNITEIIVIKRSCMATLQTINALSNYLQLRRSQGTAPVAVAYVVANDVEGANLMSSLYQRCYESNGVTFNYCKSEEEALAFIAKF